MAVCAFGLVAIGSRDIFTQESSNIEYEQEST